MNKYQDYKETFKMFYPHMFPIMAEAVDEAIKLFDKATPEKVLNQECPNCYNLICEETDYCDTCGQALDWSENDE